MSEPVRHAPPFYCPYCGGEDIRPAGSDPGSWSCGECRRAWRLKFLGIAVDGDAETTDREAPGPVRKL